MTSASHDPVRDQALIRDAITRYFFGVDHSRPDVYIEAFTDDAVLEISAYDLRLEGREAILAHRRSGAALPSTNHAISHLTVEQDGDKARAITYAIATLLVGPQDGGKIMIRGLRYEDDLVRSGDMWRIRHRRHFSLWQYDAASVVPAAPKR